MNDEAVTVIERADNSVAARTLAKGGALQQVRSSYATAIAVQQPRILHDVERRLLEEARLSGEDFYYGWGSGKDAIEGASVKLAMAAARCYGNCAIEALPVQDMPDSWIFTAAFVDLETGFTLTRQFRQSKQWVVYGRHDPERKDDIRFQIGQSKAARNVILNAVPEVLIRHAMDEAKAGVRVGIEKYVKENSMPKAVDLVLSGLAKVGVSEKLVLEKVGKAKREAVTVDDLVILRGDLAAIQKGQERADMLFPKEAKAAGGRAAEVMAKAGVGQKQTDNGPPPQDPDAEMNAADWLLNFADRVDEADSKETIDSLSVELAGTKGLTEEQATDANRRVADKTARLLKGRMARR